MNPSQPQAAGTPAQAYETYFVPHIFRPWAAELVDRAKPQPGERILDLACGTGIVARMVAQRVGDHGRVVGLDLSTAMVEVARATAAEDGLAIAWHVGSADAVPFPDASFDLVTIHQGLQFFPDKGAAAREIARVLVPGGRVASATWTELSDNPFNAALAEVVERHLGTPALHAPYALGDRETLRAIFVEAGFVDIEIARVERTIGLPSPDRFVDLSLTAASAAVPALQALSAGERAALIAAVRADVGPLIRDYTRGDEVVSPRRAHILLARKPA